MKFQLPYTQKPIGVIPLCIIAGVFWMAFANFSFLGGLLKDYPPTLDDLPLIVSLIIGHTGFIVIGLALVCFRYTTKPLLILLLLGSAGAAYFMDTYHVAIDHSLIKSMMNTDMRESGDLLSPRMLTYIVFLGILPAIWVYQANIRFLPFKQELWLRLKFIGALVAIATVMFFAFNAPYRSYLREHRPLRYYSNPANHVYAVVKYIGKVTKSANKALVHVGRDAVISPGDKTRELVIIVAGETARADRFSLNGYHKKTNPLLEKEQVVSFTNVTSCGTYTSYSLPCMFALRDKGKFDLEKARYTENALDVLQHAGVNVLWRDNNSSSKGVADRVPYEDWREPSINPVCDEVECRDEGMLSGLQAYIDAHPKGDILIVLHQMGNHGPAYYKRYPKAFEKFTPTCKTNDLADCSLDEINNAYDNAILYTDYFLAKTIALLKKNDSKFETVMLYVSDHGESLGENGLYLHSMPNFLAPREQRHVPMVIWLGKNFEAISHKDLKAKRDIPLTHDNLYHTLMGMVEIQSTTYDPDLDLLKK